MGKYALIWTTSYGYMPGTNASLNGLEFYNFSPEIDVYIRYWGDYKDLGEDYLSKWPKVSWSNITGSFSPGRNAYWYLVFDDYNFAVNELSKYDVVSFWGGDLCILNDFSFYFEMAEKLNQVIIGTNEHTNCEGYCQMTPQGQHPYGHTWTVPYADSPIFVPRDHMGIIKQTIDYQYMPDAKVDRMDGLNYAIRDSGHKPYVIPGNFWIYNVPYWVKLVDGGRYVYCFNFKMFSFHRKYWSVDYLKNYIRGGNEIAVHNAKIFNSKYNFFDRNCRVQWLDGLEVWDGVL